MIRHCRRCGRSYESDHGYGPYCSRKCHEEDVRVRKANEDEQYSCVCEQCGRTYDRRKSAGYPPWKYCSKKCEQQAKNASQNQSTVTSSGGGDISVSSGTIKWIIAVVVILVTAYTCEGDNDSSYTSGIQEVKVEQTK